MSTAESKKSSDSEHRTFVVQIGTVTLKFHETPVKASTILVEGGYVPADEYTLEMLKGEKGQAEQQFDASDLVSLDEAHARHFRAVPRGGGRA